MASVLITGFVSEAVAKEFIKWYEGQGEQVFPEWLECRDELTDDEVEQGAYVDIETTYPLKQDRDGNFIMVIR
jgi:hypothetical protein